MEQEQSNLQQVDPNSDATSEQAQEAKTVSSGRVKGSDNSLQQQRPEDNNEGSQGEINATIDALPSTQEAGNARTENTNELLKTETMNSKTSKKRSADGTKMSADDDGDADEEDNSQGATDGASRLPGRPALTIIKFQDNPEPFEYQQPEGARSEKNKDSLDGSGDEWKPPVMVNQDSSPLSPMKKGHLGGGSVRSPEVNDSLESEQISRKSSNRQEVSGFNGFKLKGTVDVTTAGFGAEILGRRPLANNISELAAGTGAKVEKEYIPANPILPRSQHPEQKQPPQCPLNDIKFIQLQKFKRFKEQALAKMGDGYDQVGKKNMMRENNMKKKKYEEDKLAARLRKGHEEEETEAKMDEYTHIIQNIVFARDPKIFDTKNGFVNQRAAFMHENMLNIKNLIRINEERQGGGQERFGAPRSPPPRRQVKTRQQMDYELALAAKARYKLRTDPETNLVDRSDKTLLFESRFESGNLYLAQKVSDHEYNLLMQNDINTSGHTQWFYFQVKNTRKNLACTFNVMNFTKPDSLFNYGMKVSIYSEKKAAGIDPNAPHQESAETRKDGTSEPPKPGQGMGWFKGGERISYFTNGIKKDITYTSKGYYTASFTYKFAHDDDVVYFAYSCPYSYTDCMQDIYDIEADPERRKICTRKTMCKTLAGVDCDVLTITEKGDFEAMQSKRAVVISARVHPGEAVGSWMMRGVLWWLTDPENDEARMLREKFVFKVIPMLNPDGVINGNYRCSLAGCDLNRRWKTPHKQLHPTIFYAKKLITEIHRERGLVLYCDLHGHSRKQNVFMYGCNNLRKPEECRVFPLILSKLSKFFHFGSCRFGVQKSKESTARVSVYKELKTCPNIFTMESTFSGLDMGERKGQHMTTFDFEQMGADLCRTLLIYENIHIPPELEHLYGSKEDGGPKDMSALFEKELTENKKLIAAGDGDSSGGSESEPSEDNLPVTEAAAFVPIVDKKQQLQLAKLLKKKAAEEKELEKQRMNRRKGEESPTRSPKPGQRSPLKKPDQPVIQVKPVEEKKEEKKKPEMKDACTQTERSDYQRIKKQQQQARMMQEMKEQQARIRAQQQFKSPGNLVGGQIRKSPQSQTAQRELTGAYSMNSPGKRIEGQPERHLQDMRDPKKYQLSKDKYSLFQVQNFNPAHQTAPPQVEMTSPKHKQPPEPHRGGNAPGQQISFNQKAGMNIMVNQSQPGKGGANPIIFQNPQNKNMVIQMSQLNSGIVSNGVGYNNGQPQQNRTGNRVGPPAMQLAQNQHGRFKSKNDDSAAPDFFERSSNPNVAAQQNLKAPGSTISKAGEQILQKNSKFQSPKKSNPASQSQSANATKSKHDLRFQVQAITSNHFGAIHMGGNMSFVKDGFLNSHKVGGGIDPASKSASTYQPAHYARTGPTNSGQNSIQTHNRQSTGFNPASLGSGNSLGPGGGQAQARSDQQPMPQVGPPGTFNQYMASNSQRNHLSQSRAGTGGNPGDNSVGASTKGAKIGGRVSNDNYKTYNSTQLPQGSYPGGSQNGSNIQITEQSASEMNRRNSVQRRANNQSQIEQANSRNYNQMDNIQLFKSPTNSKSVTGAAGGVGNPPAQNSSTLQGAPNSVPTGPAQLHISAIQPNIAKPFDKREAHKMRQGASPTGVRHRADSLHNNNMILTDDGKQKTLSFNPAGNPPTLPTGQGSIPSTPRKKGTEVVVTKHNPLNLQGSGDAHNSIGSAGTIGQQYFQFNPAQNASSPTKIGQPHGLNSNAGLQNSESSKQRQLQFANFLGPHGSSQRVSQLDNPMPTGVAAENSNQNNVISDKARSRVNSFMSSDANQLNGLKIMPAGGPINVLQTQKMPINSHQIQINSPGTKRQSQTSINSGNFIIQSQQQQQYQASLAQAEQSSNPSSPSKRPVNGHTNSNNIHNNRNVYRMRINQKSDFSDTPTKRDEQ